MKSKELKQYNLPSDGVVLGTINAKPAGLLFVIFLVGLFFVLIKQNFLGVVLILLSFVCTGLMPDRILVYFYDEYLVLFNHANKTDCEIIYYEDVAKWKYISGLSYDTLSITLTDDSVHNVDGFSKITYENLMNRFLKDKKEKPKKSKKAERV